MNEVSLRDYFAAKAMQSYLLDSALVDGYVFANMDVEQELSKRAYRMADVMLEARKNKFGLWPEVLGKDEDMPPEEEEVTLHEVLNKALYLLDRWEAGLTTEDCGYDLYALKAMLEARKNK